MTNTTDTGPLKEDSCKRSSIWHKNLYCRLILLLGAFIVVAYYADIVKSIGACNKIAGRGTPKEQALQLVEKKNATNAIGAYIDSMLKASNSCKSQFLDSKLFDEYPAPAPSTITHNKAKINGVKGKMILPNRPESTIAYALTITCCPDFVDSADHETFDPGNIILEATTIIKDEICDTNDALELMRKRNDSLSGHTLYGMVNPNGAICSKPGSKTEFYDRVSMLEDIGYRVEIADQLVTNAHLLLAQPYISEHIEDGIGVRDSSKLQVFRLVEHPVVVLFDFDRLFQYQISNITRALIENLNLKGYYIKTPACNVNGDALVDTSFMVIKPSNEEFNNIRKGYLNTPYDPDLGWNSKGHNQCDGELGLPGFLSYYFSITEGYEELDVCKYGIAADEMCASAEIQQDSSYTIADDGLMGIVKNGEASRTTKRRLGASRALLQTAVTLDAASLLSDISSVSPSPSLSIMPSINTTPPVSSPPSVSGSPSISFSPSLSSVPSISSLPSFPSDEPAMLMDEPAMLMIIDPPIDLGIAGNFAILSKAGVTALPGTYVCGNVGTSPIATTASR